MPVSRDVKQVGGTKRKVHRKTVSRDTQGFTVTNAARVLGVGRQHLSAVIHGKRVSKSLSVRYAALKAQFSLQ